MAEANQAYERGDETKLKRLLDSAINTPEEVAGEGVAFDLVRVIRKIAHVQKRLEEVEALLKALKQSSIYTLKLNIEAEALQGRNLLEAMRLDVEEQILRAKRRLIALRNVRR